MARDQASNPPHCIARPLCDSYAFLCISVNECSADFGLEVLKNGTLLEERPLQGLAIVTFGRSPTADVLLEHASASRLHAGESAEEQQACNCKCQWFVLGAQQWTFEEPAASAAASLKAACR
jgi:hypothetical protein